MASDWMQFVLVHLGEILEWWRWYLTEITWQLLIAFAAYIGVCVFLYGFLKRVDHRAWQLPGPPARILLVTAHPDDEVMFFGPMIYWIVRRATSQIYLLCLSIGRFGTSQKFILPDVTHINSIRQSYES